MRTFIDGGRRLADGAAAGEKRRGLAELGEPHLVGIVLAPAEAGLFAIDAELEAVLVAGRDLARPEHAAGAALRSGGGCGRCRRPCGPRRRTGGRR